MADTKEVKIILETIDGSGGGTSNEEERADTKATKATSSGKSTGYRAFQTLGLMAISTAASEAISWANFELDKHFDLKDDYIGQRNLNIATQAVNWGISSASTIASATLMGASFGPVGAAIGAALGTATVAVRTARSNMQAMEQQTIGLNKMEAQLDYTRQRSGYSLKAASIGENL